MFCHIMEVHATIHILIYIWFEIYEWVEIHVSQKTGGDALDSHHLPHVLWLLQLAKYQVNSPEGKGD